MLLFYVLALVVRDRLQRSLRGVLPYVHRFAGAVVILAHHLVPVGPAAVTAAAFENSGAQAP